MDPNASKLLALLILSTFALNGVGTTLANSLIRPRWLVPVILALGLATLRLARAEEVFWILLVQQLMVWMLVHGPLHRSATPESAKATRWGWLMFATEDAELRGSTMSLSLAMLFGLVTYLAVVAAMLASTRPQGVYQWCNLFALGIMGGMATVAANRIVQSPRRWRWLVGSFVISFVVAITAGNGDWLIHSMSGAQDWWSSPLEVAASYVSMGLPTGNKWQWWLIALESPWWIIVSGTLLWMTLLFWLLVGERPGEAAQPAADAASHRRTKLLLFRRLSGYVLLMVTGALPAYVFAQLLVPYERLEGLDGPNEGYSRLMELGREFGRSGILTQSILPGSFAELESEINAYQAQFERVEAALKLPCHCVFGWQRDPRLFSARLEDLNALRSVARAYATRAQYERKRDLPRAACDHALTLLEFSNETSRGGLFIQWLVGSAIKGVAFEQLVRSAPELPDAAMRDLMEQLRSLRDAQEPLQTVLAREHAWPQHAYRWFGRLPQVLTELVGGQADVVGSLKQSQQRSDFYWGCLITDCAIRAYRHEHHELPDDLNALAPAILPALPLDPYATDPVPFRYRRFGDRYLLYSVGSNGRDDAGAVPKDGTVATKFPPDNGDLSIESIRGRLDEE